MVTQSPHGGDNPRLPRRRFPFFTQWPLAVRAASRALVKSADSSLAGSQRHLGLAENTSLRGLGQSRQPDERHAAFQGGSPGQADPQHRPSQGWHRTSFSAGLVLQGWQHGAERDKSGKNTHPAGAKPSRAATSLPWAGGQGAAPLRRQPDGSCATVGGSEARGGKEGGRGCSTPGSSAASLKIDEKKPSVSEQLVTRSGAAGGREGGREGWGGNEGGCAAPSPQGVTAHPRLNPLLPTSG